MMVFAGLGRVASGPAGEQVSLRGTLLPLGGAPAPEHGRKASIGCPVFHLAGRQPVDIEFGTKASAAATAADLAVTGLEPGHQVASRLDHAGQFAEGRRPIGQIFPVRFDRGVPGGSKC